MKLLHLALFVAGPNRHFWGSLFMSLFNKIVIHFTKYSPTHFLSFNTFLSSRFPCSIAVLLIYGNIDPLVLTQS